MRKVSEETLLHLTDFGFGLSPQQVDCSQVTDVWSLFLDGDLWTALLLQLKDGGEL